MLMAKGIFTQSPFVLPFSWSYPWRHRCFIWYMKYGLAWTWLSQNPPLDEYLTIFKTNNQLLQSLFLRLVTNPSPILGGVLAGGGLNLLEPTLNANTLDLAMLSSRFYAPIKLSQQSLLIGRDANTEVLVKAALQGSGDFWAQPAKIRPFTTSTSFFRIWPVANLLPLIWTGQYPIFFFKCRLISSSL